MSLKPDIGVVVPPLESCPGARTDAAIVALKWSGAPASGCGHVSVGGRCLLGNWGMYSGFPWVLHPLAGDHDGYGCTAGILPAVWGASCPPVSPMAGDRVTVAGYCGTNQVTLEGSHH